MVLTRVELTIGLLISKNDATNYFVVVDKCVFFQNYEHRASKNIACIWAENVKLNANEKYSYQTRFLR